MYKIWFERELPRSHASLIDGIAIPIGPATATPENPLIALPGADAIIASSRIQYNGALMDQAPGLRVISRTGIGYDNIVLADATARGIAICNAPEGPTISTAEHALLLILAVTKQLKRSEKMLRQSVRIDFFSAYDGCEVDGLCLGLIGVGRIGSRVGRMAKAIGMRVVAFDPYVSAERARELDMEILPTIQAVLERADVVSVHAPLTPETYRVMNAERFAQMKRGAYLINTSRGGLVDEAALIHALDTGQLAGAGLDVFDPEPPQPDNPLLHRDNVIATPHIAGATGAGKDRLWTMALTHAIQVLRGERPTHLVNPEVWTQIVERRARDLHAMSES